MILFVSLELIKIEMIHKLESSLKILEKRAID